LNRPHFRPLPTPPGYNNAAARSAAPFNPTPHGTLDMTLIWIGVAVLVAAVALVLLRKPAVGTAAPRRPAARPAGAAHAKTETPRPAALGAAEPAAVAMPPVLAEFRLQRAEDLPEERRKLYAETFRKIPRPPRLLDHLLSPAFVNDASSAQLVELIVAEPLIAARVLAAINSPAYGLKAPVSSIGQAVTYLGLISVRVLCMRYILIASFKSDSPERQKMLDAAWASSALASELTQQLSQRLGFEDRGSLVSAVVLSFLGRLATTATVSREELDAIAPHGLLERTISEQKVLGLSSSQIGRLLMNDWGLPADVASDAAAIDSVLLEPGSAFDRDRASRLALCYACARLGERLAEGTLANLAAFDPDAEGDAEFFHFRSYLADPRLARLVATVRSPEVGAIVQQRLAAMRV
jgi:HD-like signal output (HDOD) protein